MDAGFNQLEIELPDASPSEASRLVSELREYLLDEAPDLDIQQVRSNAETQDLGATLLLLLAAPSTVAVARGLSRWIARRNTCCLVFKSGKKSLKVENISNKTADGLSRDLMQLLVDNDSRD